MRMEMAGMAHLGCDAKWCDDIVFEYRSDGTSCSSGCVETTTETICLEALSFELAWTPGSWDGEVSFEILDTAGNTVCAEGASPTTPCGGEIVPTCDQLWWLLLRDGGYFCWPLWEGFSAHHLCPIFTVDKWCHILRYGLRLHCGSAGSSTMAHWSWRGAIMVMNIERREEPLQRIEVRSRT